MVAHGSWLSWKVYYLRENRMLSHLLKWYFTMYLIYMLFLGFYPIIITQGKLGKVNSQLSIWSFSMPKCLEDYVSRCLVCFWGTPQNDHSSNTQKHLNKESIRVESLTPEQNKIKKFITLFFNILFVYLF